MSFAVIFSGQGNQHADMFPWIDSSDLIAQACGLLGVSNWRRTLADADLAQQNDVAQVLLTALGLTVWSEVRRSLGDPVVAAGYSVGELTAFCLAGVYTPEVAIELAHRRAAAMSRCAVGFPGGLVAVSGMASGQLALALADAAVSVAIHIGPGNAIVGGPEPGLQRFIDLVESQGASCTRLRIALASHTPAMNRASEEMAGLVESWSFQSPKVCLVGNTGHLVSTAQQAKSVVAQQISTTVWWHQCMELIASRNVRCVLEIGPSNALSRIWNRHHPNVPCRSADEFKSIAGMRASFTSSPGGRMKPRFFFGRIFQIPPKIPPRVQAGLCSV